MKKKIIISTIITAITAVGWLVSIKGPTFVSQIFSKIMTNGIATGSLNLGSIKIEDLKSIKEGLSKMPPAIKDCINKKVGADTINNFENDQNVKINPEIIGAIQNCTTNTNGGISVEFLKKIQEFYGSSLSSKDLDSLKKLQEQNGGMIPQGTSPSKNSLNLDDIKKLQEQPKMSPQDLELYNKMKEQGQFNNVTQPEIPSSGSGMGM